jgi:hypothetical protein
MSTEPDAFERFREEMFEFLSSLLRLHVDLLLERRDEARINQLLDVCLQRPAGECWRIALVLQRRGLARHWWAHLLPTPEEAEVLSLPVGKPEPAS